MLTAEKMLAAANLAAHNTWMKARKIHGPKIGVMPAVVLNKRLKTTAGRAFIHDPETAAKIDLCFSLFQEFPEDFLTDTIPHELAHFIAFRVYKEENHGRPWREVMVSLGIANPTRCHDLIERRMIKQMVTGKI